MHADRENTRGQTIIGSGGSPVTPGAAYRKWVVILMIPMLLYLLTGCRSGSSGSSNNNPVLTGVVVDGYVRDAAVTVYSDMGMSQAIGSGSTDTEGKFSITLDVATVPEIIYLKSVGGYSLDTGLPAPTMLFVGSGDREEFNITPLTETLYWSAVRVGLEAALEETRDRLGLMAVEDLYRDPEDSNDPSFSELSEAMTRVLAGGTQTGTLPDGSYRGLVLYLEEKNLAVGSDDFHEYGTIEDLIEYNSHTISITIDNGEIIGSLGEEVVTGRVQGSSLLLSVVGYDHDDLVEVAQVAGAIGLMGSVSGVYLHADLSIPEAPETTKGVFLATFIPVEGVDEHEVSRLVSSLYAGPRQVVYRNVFEQNVSVTPRGPTFGSMNVAIDPATNQVSASLVRPDRETWGSEPDGIHLTLDGMPTGMIILKDDISTLLSSRKVYLLQAAGNRRGIYLAVNGGEPHNANAIGEFYSSNIESSSPLMEQTEYTLTLAQADPSMIGSPLNLDILEFHPLTTPTMNNGLGLSDVPPLVFSGNLVSWGDAGGESFILELAETGAAYGDYLGGEGGDLPEPMAGFFLKDGQAAPEFRGTMNIMARALYSTWDDEDSLYFAQEAFAYGTITMQSDFAVVSMELDNGEVLDTVVDVSNNGGVLHMSGLIMESLWYEWRIDLFWPVGAPRGFFISSVREQEPVVDFGVSGIVTEEFVVDFIGEVFMTF
jgi:hypothetical protein